MIKNLKKKKGFTLIELIIVIAILGILAAIAVPKFGNVQKDAKKKADIAAGKVIADTTTRLITQSAIGTYTAGAAQAVDSSADASTAAGKVYAALQTKPKVQANDGITYKFFIAIDANEDVKVTIGTVATSAVEVYPTSTTY